MPNHVTNKIVFAASESQRVFEAVCPNGKFDFSLLIPEPPHIYRGDLSHEDGQDFPCNWDSWHRENWGTKWNCYQTSCEVDGEIAAIVFDAAWRVPYPVVAAFNNRFQIPFEHRYYDEGDNFWGVENWGTHPHSDGHIQRVKKVRSKPEMQAALAMELKGKDINAEEE